MNPCRNCESRTVGCHGKCEAYKEFRSELTEAKQTYSRNNAIIYLNQQYRDKIQKIKLNQGKRVDS